MRFFDYQSLESNFHLRYDTMRADRLRLTQVGNCCNPKCRAPLYAELMRFPDDEACFACNPPPEGLPTAFRKIVESNGGNLPPFMRPRGEGTNGATT